MSFQVSIAGSPKAFACRRDQSVLAALAGADAVPVGCRSGGCGVCRVQVLDGAFETGQMSGAQVSEADRARGLALACQLFPRSNLQLLAVGSATACSDSATAKLLRSLTASYARSAV